MKIPRMPLPGRLVMVGCGSIGQALLPLLSRHFEMAPGRIAILAADADGRALAQEHGAAFAVQALTRENFHAVLAPRLAPGDFLLNLSVDVGSVDLIRLCAERGALYLDTSTEPWAGGYTDLARSPAQRSNHALRAQVLALRAEKKGRGPTAVITQGANPGLASTFVKQALLELARDAGLQVARPQDAADWARLAARLGVKVIHVAERDTQSAPRRRERDEFVNTWSVAGFVGEALQPAELGWGSHERHWPADAGRHHDDSAGIWLRRPGLATRVRSWTPLQGAYHGLLIPHAESLSIADYLTLRDADTLRYRPTVHYAYYPCDDALLSLHDMAGRNYEAPAQRRILRDEIDTGMDELGVLLMGHARTSYWYGSRLSIAEARRLAPHNNATSLQVVAGILGGMVWALCHPEAGIVEPEELDHDTVLAVARPWLGALVGVYSDWTPLAARSRLYDETLDASDPWQFLNFRVA